MQNYSSNHGMYMIQLSIRMILDKPAKHRGTNSLYDINLF